jgi:hypothetical protein
MPSSAASAAICSCLRLDAVVRVEVHETTAADERRWSWGALWSVLVSQGEAGAPPALPQHAVDQSRSPALADIIGAWRVLTVAMISSGSIPCR